jgi:SAM-dependent methyltransferase
VADHARTGARLTLGRALRWLRRRWLGPRAYLPETWSTEERIRHLERVVEHLSWQSGRQAQIIRHLLAPVVAELPAVARTRGSFDFQWAEIPTGEAMLANPAFRAAAPGNVCRFTGLAAEWFRDKTVFDVGCGMGRYSWALCELGARVLSLDQSESGLRQTREACAGFPGHRTARLDLLRPIELGEQADLVWSFGVLHHTGDTRGAFMRIAPLVKPGGYLYVMIYGEPRPLFDGDFDELNEYERWRARTQNLPPGETLAVIRRAMAAGEFAVSGDALVHGYFDAIAPPINDLHSFDEVESWFLDAGFADIRRTVEARNHHVIGRRSP